MLNKNVSDIEKQQIISYMRDFCKLKTDCKVGVEYEVFPYDIGTQKPLAFRNAHGLSLQNIIESFQKKGWLPETVNNELIRLWKDNRAISFEAGGQLEYSSAPRATLNELHNEITAYAEHLNKLKHERNIGYMAVGFPPFWQQEDMPRMPDPLGRDAVLYNHLLKAGHNGLDIMYRTASIQVSLDFYSEADMIKKYRVCVALQPLISALFANSVYANAQSSGYTSYRRFVWMNVLPERLRLLDIVFDEDFGFDKYVDFVLNSPMVLLSKDGRYTDANGISFSQFLEANFIDGSSDNSLLQHWDDHIASFWPEVRLKNVLELRGIDSNRVEHVSAIAAIWVGLLYDADSLDAALNLVSKWSHNKRKHIYNLLINEGMSATIDPAFTAKNLLKEILDIAKQGLTNRFQASSQLSDNESAYLEPAYELLVAQS